MSIQESQTTEEDDLYETTEDDDQYEKDLLLSVQAAARQAEELRLALARSEDTKLELKEIVGRRDVRIAELVAHCQESDSRLAELEEIISRQDVRITGLVDLCQEKDFRLAELQDSLSERDARITKLDAQCQEKDSQLAELRETISQRDERVAELVAQCQEKDTKLAESKDELAEPSQLGESSELTHREPDRGQQGSSTNQSTRNGPIPTIQEEEQYKVSELDLPSTPSSKLYPRQSIGQWSESRIKNNMSVKSLIRSMEKQRIK